MLDDMIADIDEAVRSAYPTTGRVSITLEARPFKGVPVVESVHVIFFVDERQFSFPMYRQKDYVAFLKEQLHPSFDPIFAGA